MIFAAAAAALVLVVAADPGTSAANADVRVETSAHRTVVVAHADRDGRVALALAPGTYEVTITKPGFAPAHARLVVGADTRQLRVALHATPASALRTIGAVSAAERGAFNTSPVPETVVPREAYRDMSQPGLDDVLTQKPSVLIDRAGRGIDGVDRPPVALVRGGTPLETQVLLEGVPVAPATTRALALTALPSFVTQELEVEPGSSALVPTIDGAVNGTLNVRFAEPTPVWRALPEQGFDSRGGSFTDVTGGGASGNVAFALAATASGETRRVRVHRRRAARRADQGARRALAGERAHRDRVRRSRRRPRLDGELRLHRRRVPTRRRAGRTAGARLARRRRPHRNRSRRSAGVRDRTIG